MLRFPYLEERDALWRAAHPRAAGEPLFSRNKILNRFHPTPRAAAHNVYIELHENHAGKPRAYVSGTRVRVQDVYIDAEIHGMSPDEIAAGYPHLSLAQVHAALAYYFDHRQQIQGEIREDRDLVEELKSRTGPGPLERKVKGTEARRDTVPPR